MHFQSVICWVVYFGSYVAETGSLDLYVICKSNDVHIAVLHEWRTVILQAGKFT